MIDTILKKSVSDPHLARLAEEARDNAEVYLLAKKRQKGCDGMGEAATLEEEFMNALDELIRYCIESKYLPGNINFDPDILAQEIIGSKGEKTA